MAAAKDGKSAKGRKDEPEKSGSDFVKPKHGTSFNDGSVYHDDLGRVYDLDVEDEMNSSFLAYSMSVIVSRALPDARDGLKPVQRRILYSAFEMGLRPDRTHVKSARIVGECMGKYHPHGDSAIYEALVRMAQEWSLNVPLIHPQGNFGSRDDGPAASRYTEARLSKPALSMIDEIDEGTVDFRPTYDDSGSEPVVLPSGIPNLLVNGVTGIAVGMATNMAPHNLVEVVNVLRVMLSGRKISDDEIFEMVPGPDFPTGGIIVGTEGVREGYKTGRGMFKLRAVASITDVTARKKGIVVTELPYTIGPEQVIDKIKEAISNKRLQGIADVKDLSDRKTGLKLVIEAKAGYDPEALLAELWVTTPLQISFGVNNVALVDGTPRTLSLRELCEVFIAHRVEVVTRRSQFRLDKAQARAHIITGLVVALGAIERVVALIKAAKDTESARAALMKEFLLDEIQCAAILEMTLRRLTGLEVSKLTAELKELDGIIKYLNSVLASDKKLRGVVSAELDAAAVALGGPRRSRILEVDDTISRVTSSGSSAAINTARPVGIACSVVVAADGRMIRVNGDEGMKALRLGAAGKAKAVGAGYRMILDTSSGSLLAGVTTSGRVIHFHASDVPESLTASRSVISMAAAEELVCVAPMSGLVLTLVTERGVIKRIKCEDLPKRSGGAVINLSDNDHLAGGFLSAEGSTGDVVMITDDAQLLRSPLKAIRAQGASASGVAGMKVGEDCRIIGVGEVTGELDVAYVVTVTDKGFCKVTKAVEYPVKGRYGSGVRCMVFKKGGTKLVAAAVLSGDVLASFESGGSIFIDKSTLGKRDGSGDSVIRTDVKSLGSWY